MMSEKLSLKERMEKAKQASAGVFEAIGESLVEKNDAVDGGTIGWLGELVGHADKIGMDKLCADMIVRDAEDEWFSLSLKDIRDRLNKWAGGESKIKTLVSDLDNFLSNRFVSDAAWGVITSIERPCRAMRSQRELWDFLWDLEACGLVYQTRKSATTTKMWSLIWTANRRPSRPRNSLMERPKPGFNSAGSL